MRLQTAFLTALLACGESEEPKMNIDPGKISETKKTAADLSEIMKQRCLSVIEKGVRFSLLVGDDSTDRYALRVARIDSQETERCECFGNAPADRNDMVGCEYDHAQKGVSLTRLHSGAIHVNVDPAFSSDPNMHVGRVSFGPWVDGKLIYETVRFFLDRSKTSCEMMGPDEQKIPAEFRDCEGLEASLSKIVNELLQRGLGKPMDLCFHMGINGMIEEVGCVQS